MKKKNADNEWIAPAPEPEFESKMAPEIEFSKITLKHYFEPAEKVMLSEDAARIGQDLTEAQGELLSIKADYNARIKDREAKITQLFRKINDGFEMREKDCEVLRDYQSQTVFYYFPDVKTGELVKDRRMRDEEIQRHLFDEDEKEKAAGEVVTGSAGAETETQEG